MRDETVIFVDVAPSVLPPDERWGSFPLDAVWGKTINGENFKFSNVVECKETDDS
jgi:hypothetical protein